ncbi:MAG: hypothetical protein WCQ65_10670 [Fermentimonas sp.]|jgi:hypothetical protein
MKTDLEKLGEATESLKNVIIKDGSILKVLGASKRATEHLIEVRKQCKDAIEKSDINKIWRQ